MRKWFFDNTTYYELRLTSCKRFKATSFEDLISGYDDTSKEKHETFIGYLICRKRRFLKEEQSLILRFKDTHSLINLEDENILETDMGNVVLRAEKTSKGDTLLTFSLNDKEYVYTLLKRKKIASIEELLNPRTNNKEIRVV